MYTVLVGPGKGSEIIIGLKEFITTVSPSRPPTDKIVCISKVH